MSLSTWVYQKGCAGDMLLGVTHPEGVVAMLLVVTTLHAMGIRTRITSGLIGRPLGLYHGPDFAYLLLRSQAVKRYVWCFGKDVCSYFQHSGTWKLSKATPLDLYPKPKTKHDLIM